MKSNLPYTPTPGKSVPPASEERLPPPSRFIDEKIFGFINQTVPRDDISSV